MSSIFKKPMSAIFVTRHIPIKISVSGIIVILQVITGDLHTKIVRINPKEFKIPVIFHNLRGYDSHFIMQEIGSIGKEHDLEINCIPNNMEKYMAFMFGKHLVFLDSFQFMSSSLDRLAANLPIDAFKYTFHVFQGEKLALMKQKGVYPYDYMDSKEKLK